MNQDAIQGHEPEFTKLTAKLYPPVLWAFDRQLASALLRRDAFLDRTIAIEIPNIRADLAGARNSDAARRHISACINKLGGAKTEKLIPVSIAVRKTTAEALRELVTEHNLCRDGLINWIIVLLRSTDALLKILELPKEVDWRWASGLEGAPTSPLKMIESAQWDPFYYLRAACIDRHGCGLYSLPLPPALHGMQTVLADEWVPRTNAFKERVARDEEMGSLLDLFEDKIAASKPAAKGTDHA